MVKLVKTLLLIVISLLTGLRVSFADTVTLQWDPSLDPDVVGYHLYYGAASQTYTNFIDAGPITTVTLSNLVAGVTYYFAATTLDSAGLESGFSSEVTYQPPCSITLGNLIQDYDGTPKPVTVTTLPADAAVILSYNGLADPPTDAGSYLVTAVTTGGTCITSVSNTLTINRATASILLNNLDQTYDGSPKHIVATTLPPGLAVGVAYNGLPDLPTEAGSYELAAGIVDPNYSGTATNTLIIEKAAAGILLRDLDQIYSGTPRQVWALSTPPGLALILTYNGGLNWPIDAGSYEVTATVEDPDYAGSSTVGLVIHKANATVQLANLKQLYDGTTKPVVATTIPPGLKVILTYGGQSRAPSASGSYAVVGTVDDLNYQGSSAASLTISAASASADPRGPALPTTADAVSQASPMPAPASQPLLIAWPESASAVTVWQSTDFATWVPLTNVGAPSSSVFIAQTPGPHFFRASSVGAGGTNALTLSIRKP